MSNLVLCVTCERKVSIRAAQCPYCGDPEFVERLDPSEQVSCPVPKCYSGTFEGNPCPVCRGRGYVSAEENKSVHARARAELDAERAEARQERGKLLVGAVVVGVVALALVSRFPNETKELVQTLITLLRE